jgi:hypothetical protein
MTLSNRGLDSHRREIFGDSLTVRSVTDTEGQRTITLLDQHGEEVPSISADEWDCVARKWNLPSGAGSTAPSLVCDDDTAPVQEQLRTTYYRALCSAYGEGLYTPDEALVTATNRHLCRIWQAAELPGDTPMLKVDVANRTAELWVGGQLDTARDWSAMTQIQVIMVLLAINKGLEQLSVESPFNVWDTNWPTLSSNRKVMNVILAELASLNTQIILLQSLPATRYVQSVELLSSFSQHRIVNCPDAGWVVEEVMLSHPASPVQPPAVLTTSHLTSISHQAAVGS